MVETGLDVSARARIGRPTWFAARVGVPVVRTTVALAAAIVLSSCASGSARREAASPTARRVAVTPTSATTSTTERLPSDGVLRLRIHYSGPTRPSQGRWERIAVAGRRTYVWLPGAYESSPGTRFPVVYLLHGVPGTAEDWAHSAWADVQVDALIAAGRIPPPILVLPSLYPSRDVNPSAACGPEAEANVVDDVVPAVDAKYRTSSVRVIGGLSDGGGCAVAFATNLPDLFAAAFSVAGYFPVTPNPRADVPILIETGVLDSDSATESRGAANAVRHARLVLTPGLDHSWPAFSQDLGLALPWAFSVVNGGAVLQPGPLDDVTLGAPAVFADGKPRQGFAPTTIRLADTVAVPVHTGKPKATSKPRITATTRHR